MVVSLIAQIVSSILIFVAVDKNGIKEGHPDYPIIQASTYTNWTSFGIVFILALIMFAFSKTGKSLSHAASKRIRLGPAAAPAIY